MTLCIFSKQTLYFFVLVVLGSFHLRASARPMPRGRPATGPEAALNFIFLGDCRLGTDGSIVLKGEVPGSIFYKDPFTFVESVTHGRASFRSSFVYSMRASSTPSEDGVAFVITANPWSVNSQNVLGIKIEIVHNKVIIDVGNINSVFSVDAAIRGIDLRAGIPVTILIDYDSRVRALKVWLNGSSSPLLVRTNVDLFHVWEALLYAGFTITGKGGGTTHIIKYWSFNITGFSPGPPSDAPVKHQKRAAAPSPPTKVKRKFPNKVWILVALLVLIIILTLVSLQISQLQKMHSTNSRRAYSSDSQHQLLNERFQLLKETLRRRPRRHTIP